jgi:hypothetical protein
LLKGSSVARKRKSKPTRGRRAEEQRVKDRLAHAQDDAQRLDIIPTMPEEALRPARVSPLSQNDPTDHLSLIIVAARNNWATPDEIKPQVVDNLARIATGQGGETLIDRYGEAINTGPSLKTQVYAAKVLTEIDQIQWERNNPGEAGKAKGTVNVGVQVGVNARVSVFGDIKDLIERARIQRECNAGRQLEVVEAIADVDTKPG